jgi:hypothetical protein
MKRSSLLVGALCAVMASAALAAVGAASWTNATQNTDQSPIPVSGAGSIANTRVEYGPCNAAKDALASVTGTLTVAGTVQAVDTPDLPPGDWCARAQHVNTYGQSSAWSVVASKAVSPPVPKAPTGFTFG